MNLVMNVMMFLVGLICGMALYQSAVTPAHSKELVIASSYGDPRDIRRTGEHRVATGAPLNPKKLAVAHRTLPFGTWLTLKRGRNTVVAVVNDRGPFIRGRELDLTPAVNQQLRCYGLCRLKMEPWNPPLPRPKPDDTIAWGEE